MKTDREQQHEIVVRVQQIYARLKELFTGKEHPETEETEEEIPDLMEQVEELEEEKEHREKADPKR